MQVGGKPVCNESVCEALQSERWTSSILNRMFLARESPRRVGGFDRDMEVNDTHDTESDILISSHMQDVASKLTVSRYVTGIFLTLHYDHCGDVLGIFAESTKPTR